LALRGGSSSSGESTGPSSASSTALSVWSHPTIAAAYGVGGFALVIAGDVAVAKSTRTSSATLKGRINPPAQWLADAAFCSNRKSSPTEAQPTLCHSYRGESNNWRQPGLGRVLAN